MAGVKGRSGRKSHYNEATSLAIVEMSQRTVLQYLSDNTISLEKRLAVAKDFALKVTKNEEKGESPGDRYTFISGGGEVDTSRVSRVIALLREKSGASEPI